MARAWPITCHRSVFTGPSSAPRISRQPPRCMNWMHRLTTPSSTSRAKRSWVSKLARYAVEMARVIAGDEESCVPALRFRCWSAASHHLALDRDGMESALVLAEAGLPVGFMSMANAGSTGPATLAGTLVTGDAEIVAAHDPDPDGLSRRTGFPFDDAGHDAPAHGRLSGYSLGRDAALSRSAWNWPTIGAYRPWQASLPPMLRRPAGSRAGDAASSLMLCALTGAETGSGLGLLESCTLLYPEELILDSDIYHRIRLEAAGLDTSSEALALDVIKAVGPRGQFLQHRHTRENMRRRIFSDLTAQPLPAVASATRWRWRAKRPTGFWRITIPNRF